MAHSNPQQTIEFRQVKNEPAIRFFAELHKKMNKDKDLDKLNAVGGVQALSKALGVAVSSGINTNREAQQLLSPEDRKEIFGDNNSSTVQTRTPFAWTRALIRKHLATPLIIAAIINTILGFALKEERENEGWIVGIGICIFAFILILSSLAIDCKHFQTRRAMNRVKTVFDVTVIRDGIEKLIKNTELLVGDILVLTKDVNVAADGLMFVNNDLFINEEVVSGDSEPVKKTLIEDPFCRSGTEVTNGSGTILVTAVGKDSEQGQTIKMVSDSTNHAEKWMSLSKDFLRFFSLAALGVGVLSFTILLIGWLVGRNGYPISKISDEGPVHFLIFSIVIMVVELPYWRLLFLLFGGIYNAWKCAKHNIIFHAPYTFGWFSQVSCICFDKTGTLTKNRMTVVEGWFQGKYFVRIPKVEELDSSTLKLITENTSLNSEAFLNTEEDGTNLFAGTQTECALLVLAKKFGVDYADIRKRKRPDIIKNYRFDSDKKMSSVIVKHGDLLRLYNKGAAEMVLDICTEYVDPLGFINPISEDKRIELENTIKRMASQGLRTLALTYTDLEPNNFNFSEDGAPLDESVRDKRGFAKALEEKLVLLAIVGMKDPIREGVPEVVKELKKARITIRMMTGDSFETAKHVARECGILTSDGLAMEGAEFRRMAEEDVEGLMKYLPRLQVLARLTPSDKHRLVQLLARRDKVAVSGDGTNDARAMKESLVSIAMGTNSTQVAREAADTVIHNDKISSILSFYLLSRRYWLSLWGYAQFRFTETLVVWIVVLVSVCVGGETPLNAHQFLWAMFVVDTLVSFIFLTESPPSRVPEDGSNQAKMNPLIGDSYWVHIFFQSLYQSIVIVCTFCSLSSLFERYNGDEDDVAKMRKNSLMFNIFVFIQLFNSLNCRKVFDEYNIFEGLFNSPLSFAIRLVTIGLQLTVMLTPVRTLFKVTELNAWEWLYSMAVSVAVIPLSTFIRYDAKMEIIDLGSRLGPIVKKLRCRL